MPTLSPRRGNVVLIVLTLLACSAAGGCGNVTKRLYDGPDRPKSLVATVEPAGTIWITQVGDETFHAFAWREFEVEPGVCELQVDLLRQGLRSKQPIKLRFYAARGGRYAIESFVVESQMRWTAIVIDVNSRRAVPLLKEGVPVPANVRDPRDYIPPPANPQPKPKFTSPKETPALTAMRQENLSPSGRS